MWLDILFVKSKVFTHSLLPKQVVKSAREKKLHNNVGLAWCFHNKVCFFFTFLFFSGGHHQWPPVRLTMGWKRFEGAYFSLRIWQIYKPVITNKLFIKSKANLESTNRTFIERNLTFVLIFCLRINIDKKANKPVYFVYKKIAALILWKSPECAVLGLCVWSDVQKVHLMSKKSKENWIAPSEMVLPQIEA